MEDQDMFTLGVGPFLISIPILGLCDEMKKSLVLSSLPFWLIAIRESVYNFGDMTTFYCFVFVLIFLEKIVNRDPFQDPQHNFLTNLSTTMFGATGIYLIIIVTTNFLKTLSIYWQLYLLGTCTLFLLLVYWQSRFIQYLWDHLGKLVYWLTSPQTLDSMGDSVHARPREIIRVMREHGIREMGQTSETPPHHQIHQRYISTLYGNRLRKTPHLQSRRTVRCVSSCHQ